MLKREAKTGPMKSEGGDRQSPSGFVIPAGYALTGRLLVQRLHNGHFLSRTGLFLLKAIAPAVKMGALTPGAVYYSTLFAVLWLFFPTNYSIL